MKIINFLFNLIIAAGVFMILGTAGGSDMGSITLSEIFTYTLSGIALILVGHSGKTLIKSIVQSPKKANAKVNNLPVKRIRQRHIAA